MPWDLLTPVNPIYDERGRPHYPNSWVSSGGGDDEIVSIRGIEQGGLAEGVLQGFLHVIPVIYFVSFFNCSIHIFMFHFLERLDTVHGGPLVSLGWYEESKIHPAPPSNNQDLDDPTYVPPSLIDFLDEPLQPIYHSPTPDVEHMHSVLYDHRRWGGGAGAGLINKLWTTSCYLAFFGYSLSLVTRSFYEWLIAIQLFTQ